MREKAPGEVLLARAEELLQKPRSIAVLGVSSDPHKYGREVFDVLRPKLRLTMRGQR